MRRGLRRQPPGDPGAQGLGPARGRRLAGRPRDPRRPARRTAPCRSPTPRPARTASLAARAARRRLRPLPQALPALPRRDRATATGRPRRSSGPARATIARASSSSPRPRGQKPTRDDLERIILHGIANSSMPSFEALMDPNQIQQVIDYVIFLSARGQTEQRLILEASSDEEPKAEPTEAEIKKADEEYKAKAEELALGVFESWKAAESEVLRPLTPRTPSTQESILNGKKLFLGQGDAEARMRRLPRPQGPGERAELRPLQHVPRGRLRRRSRPPGQAARRLPGAGGRAGRRGGRARAGQDRVARRARDEGQGDQGRPHQRGPGPVGRRLARRVEEPAAARQHQQRHADHVQGRPPADRHLLADRQGDQRRQDAGARPAVQGAPSRSGTS